MQKKAKKNKVGRSTYMKVASAITGDMDQEVRCCDFVTEQLVNEQVHMLQRIITELIDPKIKRKYTEHLLLVQKFLKYQFDKHANRNDNVSNTI